MKKALPLLLCLLIGCEGPSADSAALELDGGASDADAQELDEFGRPKALFTLAVARAGSGTGSVVGVTSTNTIISCGTDCAETIILPTTVTLTALPATATSRFSGWSGGCSGTATTCTVTVGPGGLDVTARFELLARTLSYSRVGNGFGNVTATANGGTLFSCASASCGATVSHGTLITLRATPNADARFDRWEGACTGTGTTCTVTMNAAKTVRAKFVKTVRLEIVVKTYDRGGRVRLDSGTTLCTSGAEGSLNVCTSTHDAGAQINLQLIPSTIGRFDSGPCEGDWGIESLVSCPMTLTSSRRIDVSFYGISF